jgi:mannose-6-phosphate isomerase-like protein (cupin superfamily)
MFKKLRNREFMNTKKLDITEKLSLFNDYWYPRIVGELNGQHIKLVKLLGEFVWHKHDIEDEMFLVIRGILKMEFRDKTVEILPNEFIIVPRGVEHRPVADNEVEIMLFEPASTLNTGDSKGEFTREVLEKI